MTETIPEPKRTTYVAMSILVIWHTAAMVIAPAPGSPLSGALRRVVDPYLTFFGLRNEWRFFAPTVSAGYRFSYVIEDIAGKKHAFTPADRLNNLLPASIWQRDHYNMIMTKPEIYGDIAAADLCLEHASLNPVNVTLMEVQQNEFWPDDWRDGKRPTDATFTEERILTTKGCPGR